MTKVSGCIKPKLCNLSKPLYPTQGKLIHFSSPEPMAHRLAYNIITLRRPSYVVRRRRTMATCPSHCIRHKGNHLAHQSQRLTGELIIYLCSGARRPYVVVVHPSFTISMIFFSESKPNCMWSIHTQVGRTKVYINGPGQTTKMVAMAINRKKNL